MNLKKNIFSYIIWAVFAVLCGLAVSATLEAAGFREMFGWNYAGLILCATGYLLFTVAVFAAFRTICREIKRHIKSRERAEAVCLVVLPVLILLGVVAYLVWYLLYHTPLMLRDDTFYRAALVTEGWSIPFSVQGVSFFYTWLLHGMLLIFGNTPFAGIVLQIALYFVCLLLLYIGMQGYAGAIPGAASIAVFGFCPVSLEYVFSLTPELFYLALFLAGFCLMDAVRKKFMQSDLRARTQYVLSFFAGLAAGFLVCLDGCSVALYFFPAALLFADKGKRRQAFGINGLALSGGILGFLLTALGISLAQRMTFGAYLSEYAALSFQKTAFFSEDILRGFHLPGQASVLSTLLISPAFFILPAFFLEKNERNGAFILNLLLWYGLMLFGPPVAWHGEMMVLSGWSMLAGLGIRGACKTDETGNLSGRPAKGKDAGKEKAVVEKTIKKEGLKEKQKKMGEETKTEAAGGEKVQNPGKAGAGVNAQKAQQKQEQTPVKKEAKAPAPGSPLHNPLPLPKRKSRPQADFDHPVKEADMKFDVEVADNDDFDV